MESPPQWASREMAEHAHFWTVPQFVPQLHLLHLPLNPDLHNYFSNCIGASCRASLSQADNGNMKERKTKVAIRALGVALCALLPTANAFYLPGVAPVPYRNGSEVKLYVNALSSSATVSYLVFPTTQSLCLSAVLTGSLFQMLPYDYYHGNLNMCQPKSGIKSQSESLGSILMGDRLYNSPFEVSKDVCLPLIWILAHMVLRCSWS